jgi:hypothetical protein
MIGTRRAEHEAGAVSVGQEAKQLGQDVARLEIRRNRMSGSPATSEWIPLSWRLLLMALSKAQGAVDKGSGDLPAVGHLAQAAASRVAGIFELHFDGGEYGHLGLCQQREMPDRWRSGRCRLCPRVWARC